MRQLSINPVLVGKINPILVGESAREQALKDAARPRLGLAGVLGLAGIGLAAWVVFRVKR